MHRVILVLYFLVCAAWLVYSAAYIPTAALGVRRWLWAAWALAIPLLVYAGARAW